MSSLERALKEVRRTQEQSQKPLAVILAGHNGSGKSTMWYAQLASEFQIPLVNADRMMMSILPEDRPLPDWARHLRDTHVSWMQVAQRGVDAFVVQAMRQGVPFAMETVFSHWKKLPGGKIESKIDRIEELQKAGYFVLLYFVGLSNAELSAGRVLTRVAKGGHAVDPNRLIERFPRTQKAVNAALDVADAAILVDNSRTPEEAFTVCHVRLKKNVLYDCRQEEPTAVPAEIREWLPVVADPRKPSRVKPKGQ